MNWREEVKNAMIEKGISQKELSKLSGVTEASISRYMNDGRTPRINTFYKIMKALGLNGNVDREATENVNHPTHYNKTKYECIDEMILLFGVETVKSFCKCNIYKYKSRAPYKNGEEDLKKADWYLDKLKELGGEYNE